MIAADTTLRDTTVAHADATLRLVDLLRASSGAQFDKSPGGRTTSALNVEDPTGEIATSTSRLALRAQVLSSLATIEAATASLARATTDLEAAFDRHQDPYNHLTYPEEPAA